MIKLILDVILTYSLIHVRLICSEEIQESVNKQKKDYS